MLVKDMLFMELMGDQPRFNSIRWQQTLTFEPIIVGDLSRVYIVVWQSDSMSLTRYGFSFFSFFLFFLY